MTDLLNWVNDNAHSMRIIGGFLFVIAVVLGFFWMLGYKSDAAAYIVQSLSTLLFALPSVARYFLGIKPVKEMSFNEILSFIKSTSPKDDWYRVSRGDLVEMFLKIDPRLRFKIRHSEDGIQNENFQAAWANIHPDPSAVGYWCDLTYNGDFLDRIVLVDVDGGRATLPVPNSITNTINSYHYQVASIFDYFGTLDEYILRSKLNVTKQ